ncbi:G1 family glutamic endopeptidase [Streptomyces regalis]|uniref:G1 family glutamic endopeptidase n=1 Tax=Streptomyces regalis TaxID=68262 RepID=UPI000AD73E57|nr:G1 family glutamic endopeptidase [Streptomyces regalis]
MKHAILLAAATAAFLPANATLTGISETPAPSNNYAGLEVAGPEAHSVEGAWEIPNVKCPSSSSSSTPPQVAVWVGLGGIEQQGSEPLIQIGSLTSCLYGKPFTQLVWQQLGRNGKPENCPVDLGVGKICVHVFDRFAVGSDKVSVRIQHVKDPKRGWIYKLDAKKNNGKNRKIRPLKIVGDDGHATNSKEWIVERTTGSGDCLRPFPAFGDITIQTGTRGKGKTKQFKIIEQPKDPKPGATLAQPVKVENNRMTVRSEGSVSGNVCPEPSHKPSSTPSTTNPTPKPSTKPSTHSETPTTPPPSTHSETPTDSSS